MVGRKKADSGALTPRHGTKSARTAEGSHVAAAGQEGASAGQQLKPRVMRPGKLTDEVLERICQRIAEGATKVDACASEGVSDTALHMLRKARPDVDERVRIAEGEGVRWYRERIATCEAGKDARDDWKRWAWLAERLHPRDLKPPPQENENNNKHAGPDGGAIPLSVDVPGLVRIARSKEG